jgi:carbamoyltransferase
MYILGINAAFHDPAAALIKDGRVIAAAEEERFTHVKHGKRPVPFSTYELPFHAIDYCLKEAGITVNDVDHFAYSYDPVVRLGNDGQRSSLVLPLEPSVQPVDEEWETGWDPLFLSHIVNAPRHLRGGVPHHLEKRFRGARIDMASWHFVNHHLSHAASAFYLSPFDRAAILTIDGRGEKATTTYAVGNGNRIGPIGQVEMPHSLGILYEQVTSFLGFLHSCDEYKVMSLASYGRPRYLTDFRRAIEIGRASCRERVFRAV